MSEKIILDNFADLLETVQLQNFDKETKEVSQFKKAVLVKGAPKKAVLVSKAPAKKPRKGNKFTAKKKKMHGRMVHYTNVKNSFKRAQQSKSRKRKGDQHEKR